MASEIKQRTVYVLTRTNKADDEDTDIYVGSTSKPLNERLHGHRYNVTRVDCENNKLYKRMRAVGLQNWEIIPLLSRTCDQKTIRQLERKWCGIMNADLNTRLPITTPDEKKQQRANYLGTNKQERRYHCKICNKSFAQKCELQRHSNSKKHKGKSFEQLLKTYTK